MATLNNLWIVILREEGSPRLKSWTVMSKNKFIQYPDNHIWSSWRDAVRAEEDRITYWQLDVETEKVTLQDEVPEHVLKYIKNLQSHELPEIRTACGVCDTLLGDDVHKYEMDLTLEVSKGSRVGQRRRYQQVLCHSCAAKLAEFMV